MLNNPLIEILYLLIYFFLTDVVRCATHWKPIHDTIVDSDKTVVATIPEETGVQLDETTISEICSMVAPFGESLLYNVSRFFL